MAESLDDHRTTTHDFEIYEKFTSLQPTTNISDVASVPRPVQQQQQLSRSSSSSVSNIAESSRASTSTTTTTTTTSSSSSSKQQLDPAAVLKRLVGWLVWMDMHTRWQLNATNVIYNKINRIENLRRMKQEKHQAILNAHADQMKQLQMQQLQMQQVHIHLANNLLY